MILYVGTPCVRGPQDDRAQKSKVSGSQLTREREVTRAQRCNKPTALAGQRPRVRETPRHRKRCVVINASFGHFARECTT
jgi:hypothetical protein